MVDEGLSGSLDWHLQSLHNISLPRTLGILWILSERLNDEKEDRKEHDEDTDTSKMDEDKVALITENESLE